MLNSDLAGNGFWISYEYGMNYGSEFVYIALTRHFPSLKNDGWSKGTYLNSASNVICSSKKKYVRNYHGICIAFDVSTKDF